MFEKGAYCLMMANFPTENFGHGIPFIQANSSQLKGGLQCSEMSGCFGNHCSGNHPAIARHQYTLNAGVAPFVQQWMPVALQFVPDMLASQLPSELGV